MDSLGYGASGSGMSGNGGGEGKKVSFRRGLRMKNREERRRMEGGGEGRNAGIGFVAEKALGRRLLFSSGVFPVLRLR